MINHAFTTLYGLLTPPPSGVPLGTQRQLVYPDLLLPVRATIPLTLDPQGLDSFACMALKVVESSTYRDAVKVQDPRITYEVGELPVPGITDAASYLRKWADLPRPVVVSLLNTKRLRSSYQSTVLQERVAALIISYIDRVTVYND